MNVFYEEEGTLKVGAILADNGASLQVEAPHGKRSKIKAAAVLFRFEQPALSELMREAQRAADDLDLGFLWECSSADEFEYDALSREYYGRVPTAIEAAGILLKLHSAPMYFYKRGRGRYKAAPGEALKAALASVERKKQQALAKDAYLAQILAGTLPAEFGPMLQSLLYRPDKNTLEWKALEEASASLRLTAVRVIERCGGIPSTCDFHLNRFLLEHFPHGPDFGPTPVADVGTELPVADCLAFSIDDASTTEIDDAFSVTPLANGNVRIGIHIAAPALGVPVQSSLDTVARERLSTVYFPGGKITMLQPEAIDRYTLTAGRECPALSLYSELTPSDEVIARDTRIERVSIVENLRHDTLEPLFNKTTLDHGRVDHPYGAELKRLWQWATRLERERLGDVPEGEQRPEYNFRVENDRVEITPRTRGTPIDKMVSELMIYVNSTWAQRLAETQTAAIYRAQSGGKVRMSTVPAGHAGLRVKQYAWASSPLRRYVDLVNQRQLIALAREEEPTYSPGDESLPAIMREFESAYEAYGEFQRGMERYWCLRWLLQENVSTIEAMVLRDNLCRFDELPLVMRVASLPALASGTRVVLDVSDIDLFELTLHCEFRRVLDKAEGVAENTVDGNDAVIPTACNG
ncbi:MAG: ribonuclease catalytic domain-containing protein [Burkholderiales bacterium]